MHKLFLYSLLLIFIGPIAYTFISLPLSSTELFLFFLSEQAIGVILRTILLILACTFISIPVGFLLAWLNSQYTYPLKSIFIWLVLSPLAIPLYVMGFVYYDFFYKSEALNFLGLSLSLSLGLIPYVYLLTYNNLNKQPQSINDQAKFLPLSASARLVKIHLPLVKPALISSCFIICLEVLADFGTVSVYNYETLSVSIYKYWYRYQSFDTAKWISFLLILFVLALSFIELSMFKKGQQNQKQDQKKLKTSTSYFIPLVFTTYVGLALALPLYKLFEFSSVSSLSNLIPFALFKNTFLISLYTASFCLICVYVIYKIRSASKLNHLLWLGYGVPGTFCAVAFVNPFYQLGLMDMGIIIMILALSFRFIRLAKDNIDNAKKSMAKSYDETLTLSSVPWYRKFLQVEFPLYKSFYFSGFLFIFVEVMKEMPIQLMTRPFYWQSFSIKIYEYTNEAQWEQAAPLAMVLCMFGFIPIFLMHYYRSSKYEALGD